MPVFCAVFHHPPHKNAPLPQVPKHSLLEMIFDTSSPVHNSFGRFLMKHSKAPKYIQERSDELKHEAQPKRTFGSHLRHSVALLRRAVTTWTGRIFVSVSVLLGIASGWVALVRHVSVAQTQPLNITDPFSTRSSWRMSGRSTFTTCTLNATPFQLRPNILKLARWASCLWRCIMRP